MFLYGIGIQYGGQFFAGLKGQGLKWNLVAIAGVLGSLGVALGLGKAVGISPAYSMGLFAGSLTSTATLQAAIEAAGKNDPAIGYSIAYPIGVIGPILCLFASRDSCKPRLNGAPATLQPLEITLSRGNRHSPSLKLITTLPSGVELVAIRQNGENRLPDPQGRVAAGDGLLLYGSARGAGKELGLPLAGLRPGSIARDRRTLDIARLFISRPGMVRAPLGKVTFPDGIVAKIVEVRRGDAVLLPTADLVLEYGDRVGVIALAGVVPRPVQALRRFHQSQPPNFPTSRSVSAFPSAYYSAW